MKERSRKRLTMLLAAAVPLAAAVVLFYPRASCACLPPDEEFRGQLGLGPFASTADVQRAIANGAKVGMPRAQAEEACDVALDDCERTARHSNCATVLSSSLFKLHQSGYRVRIDYDANENVSAVKVEKLRRVFGREL